MSVYNDPWNVLIQRTRKFFALSPVLLKWAVGDVKKPLGCTAPAGRQEPWAQPVGIGSFQCILQTEATQPKLSWFWWRVVIFTNGYIAFWCLPMTCIYIYIILYTSNQWMSFIDGNLKATNLGFLFFGEYLEILQCTAAADPNCARKSGWLRLCHKTARAWEGAHEKRLSMESDLL